MRSLGRKRLYYKENKPVMIKRYIAGYVKGLQRNDIVEVISSKVDDTYSSGVSVVVRAVKCEVKSLENSNFEIDASYLSKITTRNTY